jgi:hypothetical protein
MVYVPKSARYRFRGITIGSVPHLSTLEKILLPPFLDISHIVFGTKIKKCTRREIYTMFGQDYP